MRGLISAIFATVAVAALAAPAASAATDCKARIDELSPKITTIKDDRTKKLYDYDMKRAARELAENDQDECAEALDHATSLLQSQ